MAEKGSYSIRVKLVDEATSRLAKINAELKKSAAPFEKFNRQASQFGKLSGITDATNKLKSLTDGALKAGLAVAGIVGIGTLAGIAQMAQEFAASGMQLTNMSKSLGIATNKLYEMQNAAKLSGISAETMASSIKSIQNTMNDAKWKGNITALRAFSIAGVDINKDSVDAVRDKVADTLLKHKLDWSPATKRDFLNMTGVGEDMLPALQNGSAEWQKLQARAKYLTGGDDGAAAGKKMADAFNEAGLAGLGLRNVLFTELEPVITPLIKQASELVLQWRQWIEANKGVIASKVQEFLNKIKEWLPEIVFGFKALVALRVASFFYGIGTALLSLNPLTLAAGAAVLAWAQAYHNLSAAYDDWKEREDYERGVNDLKSSNADRFSHLTPEQRALVEDWHRKNNGGKGFSESPMDAQKRKMLPSSSTARTSYGGGLNGLLDAVKQIESGGRTNAVSSAGALGAYQLMPGTARQYGVLDPTNEAQARVGAGAYLSHLLAKYNGDPRKALAAYNEGEGRLDKQIAAFHGDWDKHLPNETAAYIPKVLGLLGNNPIGNYAAASASLNGNIGVNVTVGGNHPSTTQVSTSGNALQRKVVVAQSMPGPNMP